MKMDADSYYLMRIKPTMLTYMFCLISSVNDEKSNLPSSSCVSMKSDVSMKVRHDFTKEVADRYIKSIVIV